MNIRDYRGTCIMGAIVMLFVAMAAGGYIWENRYPDDSQVKWIKPMLGDPSTYPPFDTLVYALYPEDDHVRMWEVELMETMDWKGNPAVEWHEYTIDASNYAVKPMGWPVRWVRLPVLPKGEIEMVRNRY